MRIEPIHPINWVKNTLAASVDNLIGNQKKCKEEAESAKSEEPHKGTKIDFYA